MNNLQGAVGLRVLEIGEGLSGAFAGLILAAQGASVCQWRTGLARQLDAFDSAFYDRGRWLPDADAHLADLISESDVVLIDLPVARAEALGLPLTLDAVRPGQAVVVATALGIEGPHSRFAMSDITDWAAGGLAFVTRRTVPVDDVEGYTPVLPPGRQPEILGGLVAAFGAFWGSLQAKAERAGKLVDVSRQEVQAAMLHGSVTQFVWSGVIAGGPNARLAGIGMLLPTADGQIYLRTTEPHQWQALIEFIGHPSWCDEVWVTNPDQRRSHWDVIQPLIGEWTVAYRTADLMRDGQRAGVPFALSNELTEVLESTQLRARQIWHEVPVEGRTATAPLVPLFEAEPVGPAAAAGSWGQPANVGVDLRTIRVLDMGWSWAGPYGGMILADAGAEVIKVESRTRIDILRWSQPQIDGVRDHERGAYFGACNRGKQSITLNLKHEEARETLAALLRETDVLIENFSPRVLPSLGFSTEELKRINPRLVTVSMSGYGANGPDRDYISYGDHMLHASGHAAASGDEGDPHTKIGIFYGDPVAGMFAATAALAGLRQRELTGGGTHVELSQFEGLVSLIPTLLMRASVGETPARSSQRSTRMSPQGFYRCIGEDTWVAIAVRSDAEWASLRAALADAGIAAPEAPTLPDRMENADALDALIRLYTASRSPWAVTSALQGRGIAAYPVQPAARLLFDEHLSQRQFFPVISHPVVGSTAITGPILRSAGGEISVRSAAPMLGEHNAEVLSRLLGFDDRALADAVERGLIR